MEEPSADEQNDNAEHPIIGQRQKRGLASPKANLPERVDDVNQRIPFQENPDTRSGFTGLVRGIENATGI